MVSDFKKNKKGNLWKRFLFHFGGFLTLTFLIILVISDVKIYKKRQQLYLQVENLKNKIEDIKNQNDNLKQNISNSNKEQYIEKIAREELDLQKPGEKVVSFITSENRPAGNGNGQKNIFQIWLANISDFWNWISGSFTVNK